MILSCIDTKELILSDWRDTGVWMSENEEVVADAVYISSTLQRKELLNKLTKLKAKNGNLLSPDWIGSTSACLVGGLDLLNWFKTEFPAVLYVPLSLKVWEY